jgi:hypothetical protein
MKVTGYGSIKSAGTRKAASATGAGNFADVLAASEAGSAAQPAPVSDTAAASALTNLLALQEISEADIQRKKLVSQGKNMLDVLEQLRRQLLIGTLPPHVLRDLSRQLSIQKQMTADPKLNEIIEDIELRAAVELAKFEAALKSD